MSFKSKDSTKGMQENTQTVGSRVTVVRNYSVLFQIQGECPREGNTEHQGLFQCCVAPAALINSDHGLARCDQATLQDGEAAVLHRPPPAETPTEHIHRILRRKGFWEELRKSPISKVLQITASIQCLVSLLFNKGKDAHSFGIFLSNVFDSYNMNFKR